jgi:YegS/Rv2252/BmrU family lipid kinase
MEQKKLLFIFNPRSGKGLIKTHLADVIDKMVKAGFSVTVYSTQDRGDATRKVIEEGAFFDRIVCSGGDGTLDEVVAGMQKAGLQIPLGYIPAGSTNDFGRSVGISNDINKAADAAVSDLLYACDVGKFNEDNFVYVVAFGMFTEISYETPQELKKILGHLAYILSAGRSLASIPNYLMQIDVEGRVIQDRFIYGMITNSISVGGFKGMTGKDVQLDDGEFEVTLIKYPTNLGELNEIVACLTNMIDNTDLIYSFKAKKLHLISKEPIPWTRDGEFGGIHDEVHIENLHKAIQMCVNNNDN